MKTYWGSEVTDPRILILGIRRTSFVSFTTQSL